MREDYVWFLRRATLIHCRLITAEQTQAASTLHEITKVDVIKTKRCFTGLKEEKKKRRKVDMTFNTQPNHFINECVR